MSLQNQIALLAWMVMTGWFVMVVGLAMAITRVDRRLDELEKHQQPRVADDCSGQLKPTSYSGEGADSPVCETEG